MFSRALSKMITLGKFKMSCGFIKVKYSDRAKKLIKDKAEGNRIAKSNSYGQGLGVAVYWQAF
jgi:hypothetical protein